MAFNVSTKPSRLRRGMRVAQVLIAVAALFAAGYAAERVSALRAEVEALSGKCR